MKRIFLLLSLSTLLIVLLHAGVTFPVDASIDDFDATAAVAGAMRIAAIAMSAYLLVIVALDSAGRLRPLHAISLVLGRLTPACVSRLAGATWAVTSLSASPAPALANPASLVGLPPELQDPPIMQRLDGPATTTTSLITPPATTAGIPASDASTKSAVVASEPSADLPTEWTVRPGDSFWTIAEALSPSQVDETWRGLIEANRDRLVDTGNPDLLLPGQTLAVPVSSGS